MAVTGSTIEDDLAAAVPGRDAAAARRIAEALLGRDGRVYSLLGIADGGRRAVYYDCPLWLVRAVPVDASAPAGLASPRSVEARHLGRVETYIDARGPAHWTWLHPRYRWVFDR